MIFDPADAAVGVEEAISEEKEGRSWGAGDGAIASVALIVKEDCVRPAILVEI
jgi:hypothetical protein